MKPSPLAVPILVLATLLPSAAAGQAGPSVDWSDSVIDSTATRAIDMRPACPACVIRLERGAQVVDLASDPMEVVRDSLGRLWIGERDGVRVFDEAGAYLGRVGFPGGNGSFVRPIGVDASGAVHVLGSTDRAAVFDPDFTLSRRYPIPSECCHSAKLAPGGKGILAAAWLTRAPRIGYPLRSISFDGVMSPFGIDTLETSSPRTARIIALDEDGRRFTSKEYAVDLEVWSEEGKRIQGFTMPALNPRLPEPEIVHDRAMAFSQVRALRVDSLGRLWIVLSVLRPDWRDFVDEVMGPDGMRKMLVAKPGGHPIDKYTSRIHVVDLGLGRVVATIDRPEYLDGFVGDDLFSVSYDENGSPRMEVWSVELSEALK